ncbi:MAG TPA: outer membrane beta-barrel protein, partial [Gemmatimonadales bacterium]|nr:outer membrane beta-barrel protein [Gemmatimonadales bacterium]
MLTYVGPCRALTRTLCLLSALALIAAHTRAAVAQERRYLFEVGAGGLYQSFADTTALNSAAGGFLRAGLWLPLNLSVEAEGLVASSDPGVQGASISLLYNFLLGPRTWGYGKAGIGGTRYGGSGGDCQSPAFVGEICGTTTTFGLGLGTRFQLTPMLMLRAEAMVNPNKGKTPEDESVSFSNYGLNVGLSFMLGSKPIPD